MMTYRHIGIVGAGAWGSALACAVARAGRMVTLAARDEAAAVAIAQSRSSPRLPGVRLDDGVRVMAAGPALESCDAVLLAVPAQVLRSAAAQVAPSTAPGTPVVACAKGIERGTNKFMTEVIADCMPTVRPAILSGPSFATDVARGLPTAVTLAAGEETLAAALAQALGSATFRPYHATDRRGVEIGGAAKNVLAIAAGIVSGRRLGASAAAALVTRGFAELFRFGRAYGAQPETLTGLSGLGDLVLTCSSPQSRNFSLGFAIGKGHSADAARASGRLAEGAATAAVLVGLARNRGVEMPISEAVSAILDGSISVGDAIDSLLSRPLRAES
ncbi:MAG: NAD(P)-dependent glycerol-3-phosphate dehydrogenase [Hyphomicrobiales bacterium]|nr:NAD(P)-dependent glycerol-3-phosphate dehydrogenase [Hyphomicrobiales bacterium]